tara:strand:+ start:886 stop:1269 length:384 start_codon:yes stop_codon:yes gene_type:complete
MLNVLKPSIHVFKEFNVGKYNSVKHFELLEIKNGNIVLTTKINLSKDRGFAKSNPDYWVKIWRGNKWSPKTLTGLFKTKIPNIYFGYKGKKEHLILIKFSNEGSTMTLYYFENFFTNDLSKVLMFIK